MQQLQTNRIQSICNAKLLCGALCLIGLVASARAQCPEAGWVTDLLDPENESLLWYQPNQWTQTPLVNTAIVIRFTFTPQTDELNLYRTSPPLTDFPMNNPGLTLGQNQCNPLYTPANVQAWIPSSWTNPMNGITYSAGSTVSTIHLWGQYLVQARRDSHTYLGAATPYGKTFTIWFRDGLFKIHAPPASQNQYSYINQNATDQYHGSRLTFRCWINGGPVPSGVTLTLSGKNTANTVGGQITWTGIEPGTYTITAGGSANGVNYHGSKSITKGDQSLTVDLTFSSTGELVGSTNDTGGSGGGGSSDFGGILASYYTPTQSKVDQFKGSLNALTTWGPLSQLSSLQWADTQFGGNDWNPAIPTLDCNSTGAHWDCYANNNGQTWDWTPWTSYPQFQTLRSLLGYFVYFMFLFGMVRKLFPKPVV